MIHKRKYDKLDFIEIKNSSSSKDTMKAMKRQARDEEKMCANQVFDKRFVSRIHREYMALITAIAAPSVTASCVAYITFFFSLNFPPQ